MSIAKNAMSVEINLTHFVDVTIVEFVDRYFVTGAAIKKFQEKLLVFLVRFELALVNSFKLYRVNISSFCIS